MARETSSSYLFEFELEPSDDGTASTVELRHGPCGEVACVVEPGESLEALVSIAARHRCIRRWSDIPSDELAGCLSGRFTAEDINRVFGQIRAECGIKLVCVWDFVESNEPGGSGQFYVDTVTGLLQELSSDAVRWLTTMPEGSGGSAHPDSFWVWRGDVAEFVLTDLFWNDGRHNYAAYPRDVHDGPA